jgi:hypothetical protein
MSGKRTRFLSVVVALVVVSLLVVSVSAIPTAPTPVTAPKDFPQFVVKHAIKIEDTVYLTHFFNKDTLYDYLFAEGGYLTKNPGANIILNLVGHGWFNNNEVLVTAEDTQIIINEYNIEKMLPEIQTRQLKWIGIRDKNDVWVDVVYGALHQYNAPNFESFAKKHAKIIRGQCYLQPRFNKDILFDYLDTEVDNLKRISTNLTPESTVVLNLVGRGWFNNNEVVAGTISNSNATISDRYVYTVAELRASPEKYTSRQVVWRGPDDNSVYLDMEKINAILPELKMSELKWIGVNDPKEGWTDAVWGRRYPPT